MVRVSSREVVSREVVIGWMFMVVFRMGIVGEVSLFMLV